MRQAGEKHALLLTDRSEILASQYDGCAAAKRLQPESAFAPVLGVDATLRLKIARAVCVSCPGLQQKKGRFPSQGKRPTRSAERGSKALETCVLLDNGVA
ncbi:hypothetical protein [Xanthomonas phaseoli]|uniref:hypothetical protein n=1 Tax=Xanthomonas phaseoli TaxID=1985254 RepID=UPI00037B1E52|nr:hypothetical protein [Xanthomonas phaseoli]